MRKRLPLARGVRDQATYLKALYQNAGKLSLETRSVRLETKREIKVQDSRAVAQLAPIQLLLAGLDRGWTYWLTKPPHSLRKISRVIWSLTHCPRVKERRRLLSFLINPPTISSERKAGQRRSNPYLMLHPSPLGPVARHLCPEQMQLTGILDRQIYVQWNGPRDLYKSRPAIMVPPVRSRPPRHSHPLSL